MAKFCVQCGYEFSDDNAYCPNCDNEPLHQPQRHYTKAGGHLNYNDEDAVSIEVGGTKLKVSKIIKGIALCLMLFFFLPLFVVGCQGMQVEFSGWNATVGQSMYIMGMRERINGNIMAGFLFLIPLALFVIFQFKKKLHFVNGKLFLFSTGLSALGLLGFYILHNRVNSFAEQNMVMAQFTFWYYFSIILYIVSGIISVWSIVAAKKR